MFPYSSLIQIDKDSKVPVYRQIAITIINAITNGVLKSGTPLLSSRAMAEALGVHRKTVIAAYEELSAQEWISTFPRKGVFVSQHIPQLRPKKWSQDEPLYAYAHDMHIPFKTLGTLAQQMGISKPNLVIDDGRPDIRISPLDELLKTYRWLLTQKWYTQDREHSAPQGSLRLRQALVPYLSESRGLQLSTDHILITHGAQLSIYIASYLLLDAGACVLVGRPNYPMANQVFRNCGAQILEVAVDNDGIDTDEIERLCLKRKINVVYVIPHHHYPSTVTLSSERRLQLLELSKRFSFAIIEDDYDYDYHYASSPYLPLASAQHGGNIIYIGSFSKVLDPSIRVGFMVASQNFIQQATLLRKTIDVSGDIYLQDALAKLVKEGEIKRHLKRAKKIYHQRRDLLDQLMHQQLSPYINYIVPSGGMAIWVKLRSDLSIQTLARLAATHRLQINDIDEQEHAFRFGFASLNDQDIKAAVHILALCFAQMSPD
ncbi:MocR-like pyridoxine biosynthesis transcription factor PdxR [Sphingobacterium sp. SYP-B4668]|uniref:MocR-like pyridoxine biosynthesis transcription factor PdxR n=1 Tax=Sphingobacterium sp. SYP-B4668 TaxID=2996035 RepID=UPI0022DDC8F0|nr:PLP-dependent aminotransferase family protein [Sphingobacterium sp. SYP-B4668]